jgi:hypothetical protein
MFELIVTLILVIPVPRKIRNAIARQINRLDLGDRLGKVAIFIGIALTLALLESISSVHHFLQKGTQQQGTLTKPRNTSASFMI